MIPATRLPPLAASSTSQAAGVRGGMNGDSNKQDLAWARLPGLRTRPRSDWGEQEIRDYQEIVYSLEAAYGTDLSAFGIPNDRVKRKPVTYQRAPRSGRFGAHVQYSNNALCEADFVQQQLEGLVAYIGTLRTPRALSTDRTAEIDGITKGELLKSKPEEIRRSLAPAHAVIASIRPVLAWTQSQIERIAAIERNLVMNLNAHETMREF